MTREEARRLLGGYATGSLTERERKLLFDAALEDQELFDELADEHTVKELIELPGAKQRLLAALGPEKVERSWWAQPWPWAAALALATVSVSIWLLLPRTVEAPVQIAQNVEPAKDAELSQPAAAVAPQPTAVPKTRSQAAPEPPAPAPSAVTAPSPAPTAAPLEKREAATDSVVVIAREESLLRTSTAEADNRTAPIPNLPALPAGNQAQAAAPRALAPSAGFLAGIGQGTAVGALNYEVTSDGILRIVPIRAGVLEVIADAQTLFRSNPVIAGTTIELLIPPGAQQLRIDFAATANAPAVTAVPRQDVTGTLVLPGGTNPRIAVTIPARR